MPGAHNSPCSSTFNRAGEQSLDTLFAQIRAGLYSPVLLPGQIHVLDASTALLADVDRAGIHATLTNVFVRRGADVATAKTASLARDVAGGFVLELSNGTLIHERRDGSRQRLAFASYTMAIALPKTPATSSRGRRPVRPPYR